MLTILVVDDEYLVRTGIRETIHWESYNLQIIGEASNGVEGLAAAQSLHPDIIITDIRMPQMDGIEFMAKLREEGLDSKVVVLSGYDEFDYAQSALNYGASAYLLKPIDNQQLIETIQKVSRLIHEEKEVKQHYAELKLELPAIQKQFLLDLLNGTITDIRGIEAKIGFLQLPLAFQNQAVVIVSIDDLQILSQRLPHSGIEQLRREIADGISRVLFTGRSFKGLVVMKSVDETVLILQLEDTSGKHLPALKDACKEFTASLENRRDVSVGPAFTVSIGISTPVKDLTELHRAYQEALIGAHTKFLPGTHSVTYIKDEGVHGYHAAVRDAVAFLKNRFSEDITVEMAAKELFISPSYLMHLFKAELGKTFNDSLIEYRIEQAKELLGDKNNRIYEVCQRVGYTDAKYFSQLFKRMTGLSPSEFAKMKQEQE